MNSRMDLLSEVTENKVNVLSEQCKFWNAPRQYKVFADGTENKKWNHQ